MRDMKARLERFGSLGLLVPMALGMLLAASCDKGGCGNKDEKEVSCGPGTHEVEKDGKIQCEPTTK